MEGMARMPIFASLFNCWCYNNVTTLFLCPLAHAYHVTFQLVKLFSPLDVTVVFLMYMDKLLCRNSEIIQEAIREKQQLGSNGGSIMDITQRSIAMVRNSQYWLYLGNESNMIRKFFDTGLACDGNMQTYVYNVMIYTSITLFYVFSVNFMSQSMSPEYLKGLYPPICDY